MAAIFKRDFVSYFTSPIGYIYIGAYIFVLNLMFYQINILGSTSSVSDIFSFMLMMLMFTTPILTMRVFAEDFKLKTDQLLFTSPVSIASIVIGKLSSSLAVYMCLLILTLLWPLTISGFGENNISELLGNYLGILCIGAAYISMGIFISALTENQVIAAVGSLSLFVALYLLEMLAISFYSSGILPVFVMRFLLFISVFGRYGDITRGLLSLDVIVFFLSVCSVFIFLTIRRLERRGMGLNLNTRKLKTGGIEVLISVLFAMAIVLLNIFTNILTERNFLRLDITETGIYTLSNEAFEYLASISEPVDIIILEEESKWLGNNSYAGAARILQNYSVESGGMITVQFVNPDLNTFDGPFYNNSLSVLREAHTELEGMSRGDIILLSSRRATKIHATDLFTYSYNSSYNQYIHSGINADQMLISSLMYILNDSVAKAVFITNHQENTVEYLSMIFKRSGYVCEEINLAIDDIPDDTLILISSGPKIDFLQYEIEKLELYMASGGNTAILYDFNVMSLPVIDAFLEQWGVIVDKKIIFDEDYTYIPELGVIGAYAVEGVLPFTMQAASITQTYTPLGVYLPRPLKTAWVGSSSGNMTLYPLIQTVSASSYAKSLIEGGAITYEREGADDSGPFTLAYNVRALTTDRDGNQVFSDLIVAGSNMFEDDFLNIYGNTFYNTLFVAGIAGDFNPFGDTVYIPSKAFSNSTMLVSAEGTRSVLIFMVIGLPMTILATGFIVWQKRRNL